MADMEEDFARFAARQGDNSYLDGLGQMGSAEELAEDALRHEHLTERETVNRKWEFTCGQSVKPQALVDAIGEITELGIEVECTEGDSDALKARAEIVVSGTEEDVSKAAEIFERYFP